MKYKLINMYPKDHFDAFITVDEIPSWYNIGIQPSYKKYYGSGHSWWEASTDRRADSWMSSILHDLWIDELNRRTINTT